MQQPHSDRGADPFADSPDSPQDDPFASESPERLSHNATQRVDVLKTQGSTSGLANNISVTKCYSQPISATRQKLLEVARELQNITRPVWPDRTVSGGLISSTCSDPLMSGKQEAILWQHLQCVDESVWDTNLTRLVDQLNLSLPVYLDVATLDEEGISADSVNVKCSDVVSLATKLELILTPNQLCFECRAGRVELTTLSRVNDGQGLTRIYDVTPLVDGNRGGMDQLVENICHAIAPDFWLNNGGNSVITPHIVGDGSYAISTLVVVAPHAVHQQVLTLMDRLNQQTHHSSIEAALGNRRIPSSTSFMSSSSTTSQRMDDRVLLRGGF